MNLDCKVLFRILFLFTILCLSSGCSIIRRFTYPVPRAVVGSPPPSPLVEITIPVSGTDKITGWLSNAGAGNDSTPILLFLHSGRENLQTMLQERFFGDIARLQVHCLVIDYPGYGNSSGNPNENAIITATDTAFSWLRKKFPNNPKFIGGWSLGAAVAIQIAVRHPNDLKGLIVIDGWTSMSAVAAHRYPKWLIKFLMKEQYNSIQAIESVEVPTLIMHAEFNTKIPMLQGKALSESSSQLKKWLIIKGATHEDVLKNSRVWEEMSSFVKNPEIDWASRE
ncbi:MAG: alpha/beta hydrolase [Fibrobacter sp.]|nr:alpha/beta hydrolase [Fibrobacter sp.]